MAELHPTEHIYSDVLAISSSAAVNTGTFKTPLKQTAFLSSCYPYRGVVAGPFCKSLSGFLMGHHTAPHNVVPTHSIHMVSSFHTSVCYIYHFDEDCFYYLSGFVWYSLMMSESELFSLLCL